MADKNKSGNNVDRSLDIYLEEYKSLRAEVLARIQTQNLCVNYVLIILGVAVTAVATISKDNLIFSSLILLAVALLLPLLTSPLAFIFFDNEIAIHIIGSYLRYDKMNFADKFSDAKYMNLFGNLWEFKYLPFGTRKVFFTNSSSRWLLFFVPTVFPIVFLVIISIEGYANNSWSHWKSQWQLIVPSLKWTTVIFASVLLFIDIFVLLRLVRAVMWISINSKYQDDAYNYSVDPKNSENPMMPRETCEEYSKRLLRNAGIPLASLFMFSGVKEKKIFDEKQGRITSLVNDRRQERRTTAINNENYMLRFAFNLLLLTLISYIANKLSYSLKPKSDKTE